MSALPTVQELCAALGNGLTTEQSEALLALRDNSPISIELNQRAPWIVGEAGR